MEISVYIDGWLVAISYNNILVAISNNNNIITLVAISNNNIYIITMVTIINKFIRRIKFVEGKMSFFRYFFVLFLCDMRSILGNSKNDLNKVQTTSNLQSKTYNTRENRSIISGSKSVFRHKKKNHCTIVPL